MGEVARIVVPQPPALMPVEGGMETRGHAYSLHVPANATGPIAVQAATGEVLLFAATEHYYRDANGEWDVIYGAFPAEPITSGQQVRYEGPYPITDEVLRLEPERVKHVSVIYERPRRPGAHLGAGVEFGISWLVSGVALPLGRHQAIEVGPFTLPRPLVSDATGERLYGYYEVVEVEDGLQQLFAWFDAEWLLSDERIYPVAVDPTVVVGVSGDVGFVRLSTGRWVVLYRGGSGLAAKYSDDYGASWHNIVGPLSGGALSTLIPRIEWAGVDPYDRIHVVGSAASPPRFYYAWIKLDGANATVVDQMIDSSSTEYYNITKIQARVQDVNTGGKVRLVFAYDINDTGIVGDPTRSKYTAYLYIRSGTSDPNTGQLTLGDKYIQYSLSPHDNYNAATTNFCLSQAADGTIGIAYLGSTYTTETLRAATLKAPITRSANSKELSQYIYGSQIHPIDGAPDPMWIMPWSTYTEIYTRNGFWLGSRELEDRYSTAWAGMVDHEEGRLFLVKRDKDNGLPRLYSFDLTTKAMTDLGTFGTSTISSRLAILSDFDGTRIPIAFASGSTIVQETFSFNSPPLAPSNLTRGPFDATSPAQLTWQYNDPDPSDSQSAYQVQIVLDGDTVVDTGWVQSTAKSYTLPAGTLVNGQTYQWRVRTKDQAGMESPWSTYATFATSAKPVPVPIYPTTGSVVPSGEVVVSWSVSSQSSAIVRLYSAAGGQPLSEQTVTNANARQLTVRGLENGASYRWSIQVTNAAGVQGDEVFSGVFGVSYTRPLPAMDVTAAGEAAIAAVKLRWRRGWSRPGAFTRQSVSYLPDGTQVGAGQPRYYGGGIMVEEGTTNLLTENQSSVETDLTGFASYRGATLTRDTTVAWHGSASLKVTTPGAQPTEGVLLPSFDVAPGLTYTASVYVRGSGPVRLYLHERDSTDTLIGGPITSGTVMLTDSWQRVSVTKTFGATGTKLRFHVLTEGTAAIEFWVDGFQVEAKPYATSWVPGGTTRAGETLAVPVDGLTPQEGCWRQWVYVNAAVRQQVKGRYTRIFQISRGPGALDYGIMLYHSPTEPIWYLFTLNDAGVGTSVAVPDSLTPDGWHLFEVKWTAARAELWIDGALAAYIDNPNLPSAFTSAYVGCRPDGVFQPNTVFGQTQILSRYPSDAESLAAYQRGVNNLAWDEHTLALHTWANTLEGGTQESIFANWGVERSEDGIRWTRIAVVDNPDSGDWVEYTDRAVGSGRPYRYRVVAYGSNGTETKGEPVTASVVIPGGIWLHDPRDPENTAHHFMYHELPSTDRAVIPSGVFQFAGRKLPVVQMDASQTERTVRYRLYLSDETDDRAALEALYARRTTLCLRNHRGKKYYVVFTEMPLEFERRGAWADVEFRVVDFDEEV